jgi:hypothetical protein
MKRVHFRNHLKTLNRSSLAEAYLNGRLSHVLNLDIGREIDVDEISADRPAISGNNAMLILHHNAQNLKGRNDGQNETVLIDDIEFVEYANVPVSVGIRPNIGQHPLEESGPGDVYLKPAKRVFKFRGRLSD